MRLAQDPNSSPIACCKSSLHKWTILDCHQAPCHHDIMNPGERSSSAPRPMGHRFIYHLSCLLFSAFTCCSHKHLPFFLDQLKFNFLSRDDVICLEGVAIVGRSSACLHDWGCREYLKYLDALSVWRQPGFSEGSYWCALCR
jgi:hypothetical protein